MNADDGLEDIRWIRGLGGERLPAAFYANSPKPEKKKVYFLSLDRDRDFCQKSSVFHSPAAKCFCIKRLAGARHVSPAVL